MSIKAGSLFGCKMALQSGHSDLIQVTRHGPSGDSAKVVPEGDSPKVGELYVFFW